MPGVTFGRRWFLLILFGAVGHLWSVAVRAVGQASCPEGLVASRSLTVTLPGTAKEGLVEIEAGDRAFAVLNSANKEL